MAGRSVPNPNWFPSRVAFSLGDIFLALGVFWLLANPASTIKFMKRGKQYDSSIHISGYTADQS